MSIEVRRVAARVAVQRNTFGRRDVAAVMRRRP